MLHGDDQQFIPSHFQPSPARAHTFAYPLRFKNDSGPPGSSTATSRKLKLKKTEKRVAGARQQSPAVPQLVEEGQQGFGVAREVLPYGRLLVASARFVSYNSWRDIVGEVWGGHSRGLLSVSGMRTGHPRGKLTR